MKKIITILCGLIFASAMAMESPTITDPIMSIRRLPGHLATPQVAARMEQEWHKEQAFSLQLIRENIHSLQNKIEKLTQEIEREKQTLKKFKDLNIDDQYMQRISKKTEENIEWREKFLEGYILKLKDLHEKLIRIYQEG